MSNGEYHSIFVCPGCGQGLKAGERGFRCFGCGREYACESGIPLFFYPNEWDAAREDVTESVKSFYEETPFPNYDDTDSVWRLKEKAEKGIFARLLDEQVSPEAKVLEAGCGTGQLSNFLAIQAGRDVYGADLCLNSLKLGQAFKEKNHLDNVTFLQMNLFKPVFKPESFDLVVSNGVLHHTSDPFLGFQILSRLVKKGGYIVIGLYNKYGRLTTDFRRSIFKRFPNRFQFLDPRLKASGLSEIRKKTWFRDQYRHPHESKHTIGEVLGWFDRCGFQFMSGIPQTVAFERFSLEEKLFAKHPSGSKIDHFIVQTGMLLSGGREGGFFTLIGRREGE